MPTYLPQLAFQPYVTSVSQEPIQELSTLGQTLNQRYDENIAKYDALDAYVNQLQLSDADSSLKESIKNDTRAAISNIATNGDWENAKIPVREVAKRLANDVAITKAQQNYKTIQELDKQRLAAAEQGKPLIQFKDYKNFSTVDPVTGRARDLALDGVYEQKLDTVQKMREMFADVNPDSYAYKSSTPTRDEETGQIYQIGSGSQKRYLSKEKLKEVANRSFENFLNTAEGQQRLKVLTTANSENPNPLDRGTALNHIKQELLSVGLNKAFSDVSSESTQKLAPGQGKGRAGKDTSDEYRLTQDSSYQQNQNIGDLISSLEKPSVGAKALALAGASRIDGFGITTDKKGYNELLKKDIPANMKNIYSSLDKVFSNVKDPEKRKQSIVNYLKQVQNGKIEPKYYAYGTTEKINTENNYIRNSNLDGRIFLDPETNETLSWKQIKDKYKNESNEKISDKDVEKANVSGEYSEDNPFVEMTGNIMFASPQKLSIGGHKFIMGSDQQEVNSPNFTIKALTNSITRATRTGLPVKFNKGLTVIPKGDNYLIQDNQGKLRDNGGQPFSLDDLQKIMYSTGNIIPE